jgi:hypothetical protein
MSDPSFINEGRKCRALLLAFIESSNPPQATNVVWLCEKSTEKAYKCKKSNEMINDDCSLDECIKCGKISLECDNCAEDRSKFKFGDPRPIFNYTCYICEYNIKICYVCVLKLYIWNKQDVHDAYTCALCERVICDKDSRTDKCIHCKTSVKLCNSEHKDHTIKAVQGNKIVCAKCRFKYRHYTIWRE